MIRNISYTRTPDGAICRKKTPCITLGQYWADTAQQSNDINAFISRRPSIGIGSCAGSEWPSALDNYTAA